jgi:hypothetical protein
MPERKKHEIRPMNKNSWLTFHYKNGIIQHGWDEKEHRSVVTVTLPDGALKVISSLRAAMSILDRFERNTKSEWVDFLCRK